MRQHLFAVLRRALFYPVTLLVALGLTLFTSLFAPGGRLVDLSIEWRFAINAFNLFLYYAATYFLLAPVLAWGLRRYWSWHTVQILFYAPLAIATGITDAALNDGALLLPLAVWSATTSMAMVILAVTIVLLALRPMLEVVLDDVGRPGCLFRSRRPMLEGIADMLPHGVRGPVVKMTAANQYIEVHTTAGRALVRIPLKEAEAGLPPGQGVRVHRSAWIAFAYIAAVHNDGRQLRIEDKSGEVLKVGKTYTKPVLAALKQHGLRGKA